jgi:hypothetical protein
MSYIFYDIETKALLDQNAPDPDAAIRALYMSAVAWRNRRENDS